MDRRHFLLAAAALGCSAADDPELELQTGIPPWHLWGDSKVLAVDHSIAIVNNVSGQIANIRYGRPDTWHFFFAAQLLDAGDNNDAGEVQVFFDVVLGVGRSNIQIPGFAFFNFQWAAPPAPVGALKYAAVVRSPLTNDIVATSITDIEHIVSQDIQCNVRANFTGGITPIKTAQIQVSAFFSPRTHVRPEWSEHPPRFSGGENHGK